MPTNPPATETVDAMPTSVADMPPKTAGIRHYVFGVLRIPILLATTAAAWVWSAISIRAVIIFDRTGLEPWEPNDGRPVDIAATVAQCFSLRAWIFAAGTLAFALIMLLTIRRWPRWLQALMLAAPIAPNIVIGILSFRPGVSAVAVTIWIAEFILAILVVPFTYAIVEFFRRPPIDDNAPHPQTTAMDQSPET